MFTDEDCDRLWTNRKQLSLLPGQRRISVKKYEELYKLYCDTLDYVRRIRRESLFDGPGNLPDM